MFIVLLMGLVFLSHFTVIYFLLPVTTLAFIYRFFFEPLSEGFVIFYFIEILAVIICMILEKIIIGKTYFFILKFKENFLISDRLIYLEKKENKFWEDQIKKLSLVFKPIISPINKVFFNNLEKIITTIENFFHNAFKFCGKFAGYAIIFVFSFSYVLSIIKWFVEDHNYFWHGCKDLVWSLLPILNFFYVLDWWIIIFSAFFYTFKLFILSLIN